jgi:putative membrane-bound dehydrogenase-like protein
MRTLPPTVGLLAVLAVAADRPAMTVLPNDVKPFEYMPADVPFYPPGEKWGTTGPNIKRMQKPLAPAESMKHYVHPVGFELRLFADESLLGGKPIAMTWDERGRCWVAVTVDYPNELQPEGKGHDRILILEDTDGDGRADKVTVFADKLSIPTSMTMTHGGVIVTQAPHTLFLRSTHGDDHADERRVLFSGWGTRDTHAGPSNLRYGPDNWIYGMCGYSGFNGTVGGERHRFQQGMFRFRSDGSALEFLRSTNNNSWGLGFSEEGLLFGSTANGCPSVFLAVPNRYYEKVRGWSAGVLSMITPDNHFEPITDKVRQVDWHGGFTAGAGHALYTARTYPKEYWNRTAFVSDPTGHLTATFELEPHGADFRAMYGWNLLAGDDEWISPVAAEVGPDGNVWVIDWYAFIVQHNPSPPGFRTGKGSAYETPLRDKKHGRIYRLVRTGAPAATTTMSLAGASSGELVAALKSDNMFWRLHAQRLLVERGKPDVVPDLLRLVEDRSVDGIGLNVGAMHAIWTLGGLGMIDEQHPEVVTAVTNAVKHPAAGVRRAAVAALPRTGKAARIIAAGDALADKEAQVRLAALLALADRPPSRVAAGRLANALSEGHLLDGRWLTDAATAAAAANDEDFLTALCAFAVDAKQGKKPHRPPAALVPVIERVADHYARGGPVESIGDLLQRADDLDDQTAAALLAGLVRGWPAGKSARLTADQEHFLANWLPGLPPTSRARLMTLLDRWGNKAFDRFAAEIADGFLRQVRDVSLGIADRLTAAKELIDLRRSDLATAQRLLDLVSAQAPPELATGLLAVVGRSEARGLPAALLEWLPNVTPAARPAALQILVGRADGIAALLDAADAGRVLLTDLTLEQRQALLAHPNRELATRARTLLDRGGGLPNPDREKVVQQFLAVTKKTGDPAAGKTVFVANCAKCHTHSGVGGKVGPDLTGMAVHPKDHLLIDILDPSRSVEGNYRQYNVTTKSGRSLAGLLAAETRTAVEMLDAEGKSYTIQRADIDSLDASNKSLMPEGFEKQLSEIDLLNLLEFLTRRGRYLPLPFGKAATIVSSRGMLSSETAENERLVFRDWGTKTVAGVPFLLIDPQNGRLPNAILLNGPQGAVSARMPKAVNLPCNAPAKAVHLLGGVSGSGYPLGEKGSVSMIVRLHYADGTTEEHPLQNGVHIASFTRRVDVPGSEFAFDVGGRQVRTVTVRPERPAEVIREIELVKGPDRTAPIVLAVTLENGN